MEHKPTILVIMPTYGHHDYARRALESLFAATSSKTTAALIVDDGSPDYDANYYRGLNGVLGHIHYTRNYGLTHALNAGLNFAYGTFIDYIACVNSDILFTKGWQNGLIAAANEYRFVGPLSNAPGVTSRGLQLASRWLQGDVPLTDDQKANDDIASSLWGKYGGRAEPCNLNGFFMFGKATSWCEYAHNYPTQTFPPVIEKMPSGRRNPQPRMQGQEDWINHQVKKSGHRNGVALGSYIVHFRSVTRGDKFKTEGAFRHVHERPKS